ncbi:Pho4 [Kluyveromyces lactis]|nr:Pho4 [Kluyveromyces lactis]
MSDDYLHGVSPAEHSRSHHHSNYNGNHDLNMDDGNDSRNEGQNGDTGNNGPGTVGPSSAILDQVDEYLNSHRHERDDVKHEDQADEGFENSRRSTPWVMDSQHYVTEDIDMDLDHLSHALLNGDRAGGASNSGNQVRTGTNLGAGDEAPHHHDSASFLDQDSLSPIGLSGPSPSHFQLDFSLIEDEHHEQHQNSHHHSQQQQQHHGHQNSHHAHSSVGPEDSNGSEHVRPDMVFSPMVSPMVMPTNSLHNTPFMGPSGVPYGNVQNTPFMPENSSSSMPSSTTQEHGPHTSKFSPLTSPALNAIEQQHLQQRQQQQQQQQGFSLPDASISSSRKSSTTNTRSKRTPHTTPLMGPTQSNQTTNTNKIIKHSPHISSRRSLTKFKSGSRDDMVFKLPDSSLKNENAGSHNSNNHTPNSAHSSSNGSNSDRMTPSSLMNYPKIILPSNSNTMAPSNDESVLRATESPVIKPKKYSEGYYNTAATHRQSSVEEAGGTGAGGENNEKQSPTVQKQGFNNINSSSNSSNTKLKKNNGSTTTSPTINANANSTTSTSGATATAAPSLTAPSASSSNSSVKSNGRTRSVPRRRTSLRGSNRSSQKPKSSSEDDENDADADRENERDEEDDDDDDVVKKQKQVHKVAEQGRRNRLNNALKDLESLIPKELKDVAAIPSKATTVELAAQYIRQLLKANSNQ